MTRLFASIVLLTLVHGCGGTQAETKPTEPVKGKVTYDGKPVAGALVSFSPTVLDKGHYAASATTNDQGEFELATVFGLETKKDGAVADEYNVTIVKAKAAAAPSTSDAPPKPEDMAKMMGAANKDRAKNTQMGARPGAMMGASGLKQEESEIPVHYASSSTTTIRVKVPGDKYEFDLKKK
jgi:hypothetical protein